MGSAPPVIALKGSLTSSVTDSIAKGSPVKLDANGLVQLAGVGDRIFGAFWGCEYATADSYVVAPKWTGSAAASNSVAYIIPAENTVFEIQANATLTSIASLGGTFDIAANGSTENDHATGVSEVRLDSSSVGTASAQLVCIGLAPYADNDWSDTYPIVRVRVAEPQLSTMQLGVGI
jgi:hypothetical protein